MYTTWINQQIETFVKMAQRKWAALLWKNTEISVCSYLKPALFDSVKLCFNQLTKLGWKTVWSHCSEGQMTTYCIWQPEGGIITTRGCIVTLTQQWRYLNLTRNSFYILFPAKGIVSYRQIISSCLCICLKGTCSLANRTLLNRWID